MNLFISELFRGSDYCCPTNKKKLLLKIMRTGIMYFTVLLVSTQVLLAHNSTGQELNKTMITVGFQHKTLKSVLKKIEEASQLSFILPIDEVEKIQNINLPKASRSVSETLDMVLENTGLNYRQVNNRSVMIYVQPMDAKLQIKSTSIQTNQQFNTPSIIKQNVTGTVTDESGSGLPGVSIVEKGTANGTTTNESGKFTLEVANTQSVLVFSFVGFMSQEMAVGSQSNLSVSLKSDDQLLNELVVVGYGTQKKSSLTGAVSTIDSKVLEDRPLTNLASGLQGTSPGLIVTRTNGQPGNEGINITIRGATTANGSVNPLVVLDGVTAPSSVLTTLNPNDIESMSVLKDAAAATIYGAQAAGGVILITTKKGKSGKMKVNYSSQIAANKLINLPKRMSLLDEAEFNNIAFVNNGSSKQYSDFDLENIRNNIPYVVNPTDSTKYIYYNQIDPNDLMLKKYSLSQQHNLSLNGGTEKVNFFLSGGLFDQKGALKVGQNSTSRYNGRMNLGVKVNKYVSLDTRFNYTRQEINEPGGANLSGDYSIFYEISRLRMRNPQFTPEGRYNADASTYAKLESGGYDKTVRNDMEGVFTLKVANFLPGLSMRGVFGIQYRREDEKSFARTVPLWGRYTVTKYLNPNNSFGVYQLARKNTNLQYLVDYNKTLFGKHEITFLGGFQYEDFRSESISAGASNLISNDLPLLNFGDALTKTNSQGIATYAYQSYFGRLNYTFAKKYIVEGTYRVDESSKLAPGLRTKGFAALSGAWNLHEESWFAMALPQVTELKFRASWGQLGGSLGSGFGNYDWANNLNRGTSLVLGDTRTAYNYQGSIPSAALTWETITTTNYGFDLGLLNHKLRVTGDYYVKYNRNMSTPTQLPATLGISAPRKNDGKLKSWGWELEASYRDKIGDKFNYHVSFNISDNQNKLLSFSNRQVVGKGLNSLIEGYPLQSIFGYKTDGYFTSQDEVDNWAFQNNKTGAGDVKYQDLDGSGRLTVGDGVVSNTGDLVYLGTNNPRYLFGLNFGFDYHGFDFTAFFQGVGKRSYMPSVVTLMPLYQSWRSPMQIHSDYWTPENQNALYPRPYYGSSHNYEASDKWVLNAAYARLKNIQIGYSLPKTFLKKTKMDRARVFVSGQDILTISRMGVFKTIFDPESKNGVVNDYPFFATLSVGLNINF